jgi:parvulin-like peptidyl-prolyl isomerase
MDGISPQKSGHAILTQILPVLILCTMILSGCGGLGKRTKEPDLVAIAEKTKPERAVSEHEETEPSGSGLVDDTNTISDTRMFDYVVAQIDGDPITYREVSLIANEQIKRLNTTKLSAEEKKAIFAGTLQNLVTRKLVLAEAKELGYSVSDAKILSYIRSEIPEINEKFGGDIEKYTESKDLDYDDLLEGMKDEMIYNVYLQLNIFSKVSASPREVREYYESSKSKFVEVPAVHMFAITLYKKGDPEKDAEVLEKAQDILTKLRNGEDFKKLAKEHTEDGEKREKGGDWDWVTRDHFASKEISETAFELEVGGHSDIIETSVAYWILKVTGKRAENVKDLSEVWKDIEWAIRKGKISDKMQNEVDKLQKKHKVIIHGLPQRG